CGIVTDFDISTKQLGGVGKFLVLRTQICKLQQRLRTVRVRLERLLKLLLRDRSIPLTFLDVPDIEEAGCVLGIALQPLFEIFTGFIKAAEMPIREANKCVRPRGRFELDELLEFFD